MLNSVDTGDNVDAPADYTMLDDSGTVLHPRWEARVCHSHLRLRSHGKPPALRCQDAPSDRSRRPDPRGVTDRGWEARRETTQHMQVAGTPQEQPQPRDSATEGTRAY